jgi:hypothetical protein
MEAKNGHPAAGRSGVRARSPKNLVPTQAKLAWDSANVVASLTALFDYVIAEADRSENWYWQKKGLKAAGSRAIQFSAVVLAALGGIFPIIAKLGLFPSVPAFLRDHHILGDVEPGLWSSCFIGSAAALVGLDRVFGLSSRWTRYIITGSAIRKVSQGFRIDSTALLAQSKLSPDPDQAMAMDPARKGLSHGRRVLDLEGDAGLGQRVSEQHQPDREGSEDARRSAEGRSGQGGRSERPRSIGLSAGQYKLSIAASAPGKPVMGVTVVLVKPGETTKATPALPIGSRGS